MKAFNGDSKIKKLYLARVKAHRLADQIVKGQYWGGGKGCAVGCTIHSGNHSAYETELGIPTVLARLEDGIFEALPNDKAQTWPERFLKAIKPGADLSLVESKFLIWLLMDVKQFATADGKTAINTVIELYKRRIKGDEPNREEWNAAANASYASATSAAANAPYASATSAADAAAYAAYSAASAVSYAAYSVNATAYSSYAATARQQARVDQSEKLLELLKAAPQTLKGNK